MGGGARPVTLFQKRALTVALCLWLVGCGLRAAGKLPGSWWLWSAPYWLLVAVVFLVGGALLIGSHLVVAWCRLVECYHARRSRRAEEQVSRGMIRSLESGFLRGTDLSGRSETSPPPPARPDRSA